ncbi:MAG TPA: dihydrofolate reductase family protein [Erythrobacter sp.]|nr:dihydrofolate reductase family protein [Erythrobacter sp.]
MRKIHAAAFISLDGVIQGPGGPGEDTTGEFDAGGWVFRLWDEAVGDEVDRLFGRDYDLLLGRRTYDIFAAYWPYVEGEAAAMGRAFTAANKYVLTRGDRPLEWENSHRLGSIEDIAALKQEDGPDLVIQGSGTLYPPLLAAGLIDRLTLMIFPLVLGNGKRLFSKDTAPTLMALVESRVSAKGTMIATYEQRGGLPPMPDFAPPPSTSEREAERQRAMEEGYW